MTARRYPLSILLFLLSALSLQAQDARISGRLTDSSSREALPNAAVALLREADSVIQGSAVAGGDGGFLLKGLRPGKYLLSISYMGYDPFFRRIQLRDTMGLIALGELRLRRKAVDLQGVEVVEKPPAIRIKEDTVEYNAGSFKVQENALVEELLKKLPGLKVEKDGTLKAGGETIKKVLVDGKPFFGDDPKMATRNLPADVIDKIQLIDQKSEQAQFTGVNDGEVEKVLNLTVKADKKKGVFGRATAGYGTDGRFSVSGNLNRFRKSQQLAILGGGNNTNNTGFTASEGFKANSGGGSAGILRNWNGGLNYSDNPAKGLTVSGSYFMNDMRRENERRSKGETRLSADTSRFVNSHNANTGDLTNHRINARIDYKIDSSHSILATPSFNRSDNEGLNETRSTTLVNSDTLNNSRITNRTSGVTSQLGTSALFRKRFGKKGRTFSANVTAGRNTSDQESINQSQTAYYKQNTLSRRDTIDQRVLQETGSTNLSTRLSYTEPVFKDRTLELNYGYNHALSTSDRRTYRRSKPNGDYDILDDSLTNSFRNVNTNQQAGLSLMTQKLRYSYTLGVNLQFNQLESENRTKGTTISQSTTNFSPLAHFNYTFSRNRRLRASYRGQTRQPTLEELQPVPDNANPLYIRQGNPDLRPSFTNSLQLTYNTFNQQTQRSMFASLSGNYILNQIINATTLTSDGKQLVRPENVNGNYTANAYVVNGWQLNNKQTAGINMNTSVGYSRTVSNFNASLNKTNSLNVMQGLNFNFTLPEKLELASGGSFGYNRSRFSADKKNNADYFNYMLNLDFTVFLPLGFRIGGDIDYTANTGRSAGYNTRFTMVNAYVMKSVFRQQGMFRVQVYDLLDQNVSVNRTVTANFIEDVENKALRRYFMVSFTYFLKRFGGQTVKASGMPMSMPAMAN